MDDILWLLLSVGGGGVGGGGGGGGGSGGGRCRTEAAMGQLAQLDVTQSPTAHGDPTLSGVISRHHLRLYLYEVIPTETGQHYKVIST